MRKSMDSLLMRLSCIAASLPNAMAGAWRCCQRMHLALALAAASALCLASLDAFGAAVKCVDANGKVSYKEGACADDGKTQGMTVKVPVPDGNVPMPSGTPAQQRSAQGQNRSRVPTDQDFKGPREAWQRLEQALVRGDRDAALKELTPAAQQRLSETIDRLASKSKTQDSEKWGPVRSVTLTGDDMAKVTLSRKKTDGTYAYEVMLLRGSDGKWRVDNM